MTRPDDVDTSGQLAQKSGPVEILSPTFETPANFAGGTESATSAKVGQKSDLTPAPIWLTEPCPSWCDGHHRDHDDPADRFHWSEYIEVPLHLHRAIDMADGKWQLDVARAYIRQRVNPNGEIYLVICQGDEEGMSLRLVEAETFAGQILELVRVARNETAA